MNARGSLRIFQRVTTSILPCLSGLFPLSDLWYSSQSPSHRPSTPRLRELREVFSWSSSHWVLCRWLAGVNQRITPPLFLMVYILLTFSVLSHCYRTIIPQLCENVKCLYVFFFIFLTCFYRLHTLVYHTILKCQEGSERWCLWGWMSRFKNRPVSQSAVFGTFPHFEPLLYIGIHRRLGAWKNVPYRAHICLSYWFFCCGGV